MKFRYEDIDCLQVEITTHCNAACIQCPRNNHGKETIASLPLITWSLADAQKAIPESFIRRLRTLFLCGTYGDPMANPAVVEICEWIRQTNPDIELGIHTNGGIGTARMYQSLAGCVTYMAFGIDGLEDTNHLYRRRTRWSVIMRNARHFISAGGQAVWDFLVFAHNQHQVQQAQALSKHMGFVRFNVKKTFRFYNRQHELIPWIQVDNFQLRPASDHRYLNHAMTQMPVQQFRSVSHTPDIQCYSLHRKHLYIAADGKVFPCGWLHDRLYGIEAEQHPDHSEILRMIDQVGGADQITAFRQPIESIVNGAWFELIAQGWSQSRLERCEVICGQGRSMRKEQNSEIDYVTESHRSDFLNTPAV